MTGALIFSSYLVENIFNKKMFFILIVFYLVYQFSTIHYPESLISFFETYSDKFDFQKGSDLLIIYVVSILFPMVQFEPYEASRDLESPNRNLSPITAETDSYRYSDNLITFPPISIYFGY